MRVLQQQFSSCVGMEGSVRISTTELSAQFEAVEKLGQGNSGSVYVYRRRADGREVAVKVVRATREDKRREALAEIQILRSLDHQRIVKVLRERTQIFKYYDETLTDSNGIQRFEVGMLLECGLCSLQQYFSNEKFDYDFDDILRFIVKFIELGAYLQSRSIVHRDIKPGNIILFDSHLDFKLGDFGLSCCAFERPTGFAGTPAYCSPGLKWFYKQGDHRELPPTNAFKDDVYSFALTSEEVIKRRYSLKDAPREITALLDEMLRNDERQRPTFTNLLHHETVRRCQAEWAQAGEARPPEKAVLGERDVHGQSFTRKKANGGEYGGDHTQKSRKLKQIQTMVCVGGVRTVCSISAQYLLAGTSEGQLWVLDRQTGESTRLSLEHRGYVAKVAVDRNGDVWSAGGDGKVYFMELNELLRCIECNRTQVPAPRKRSLLPLPPSPPETVIAIPEESRRLVLDCEEKQACELLCEDQSHFAVGYCSGSVRVRWGEEGVRSYCIHCQPITALAVGGQTLFSADFEGEVKSYSLSLRIVERNIYKFAPELIGIAVSEAQGGRNIEGVGSRGQVQTINHFKSSRTTFHAELPAKNIVAVVFSRRQYYLLTADGRLFFKNSLLAKLEGVEWACLAEVGENELLVASHSGALCVLTLE